ncbi:MAG: glycosyltransferase family 2 protein [Candidatus Omnitrophica bacterium]|nr:glycosyltransferase family 2 protein [Candidatus Omnitrophota bacterium]
MALIKLKTHPSISVVIPTLNAGKMLDLCLQRIREQDYPQEKIEIIIMDGGSRDNTLQVAKKYGARVFVEEGERENQEKRRGMGAYRAENDLIAVIDSDNILPTKDWFAQMLLPFVEHPEVVGVGTLRYACDRKMSLLNRYFSLFGVNDPVVYYFNKRDRLSWAEEKWNLLGEPKDEGSYYTVKFSPEEVPTLGSNGFLFRRDVLLKVNPRVEEFFHIDVHCDFIKQGFDTYAFVKNDVLHLSGGNFLNFLWKRKEYMVNYYFKDFKRRRYKIYDSSKMQDNIKLLLYILYSLTFVKPSYDAFKGFLRVRDIAWFLHPFMCFAMLLCYAYGTIRFRLKI